jgi:hypothetical protein
MTANWNNYNHMTHRSSTVRLAAHPTCSSGASNVLDARFCRECGRTVEEQFLYRQDNSVDNLKSKRTQINFLFPPHHSRLQKVASNATVILLLGMIILGFTVGDINGFVFLPFLLLLGYLIHAQRTSLAFESPAPGIATVQIIAVLIVAVLCFLVAIGQFQIGILIIPFWLVLERLLLSAVNFRYKLSQHEKPKRS